jgi:hypothetical protein
MKFQTGTHISHFSYINDEHGRRLIHESILRTLLTIVTQGSLFKIPDVIYHIYHKPLTYSGDFLWTSSARVYMIALPVDN